jgi:hypothetical protein
MNRSLHLLIAVAFGAAASLGAASTSEVEPASPTAFDPRLRGRRETDPGSQP